MNVSILRVKQYFYSFNQYYDRSQNKIKHFIEKGKVFYKSNKKRSHDSLTNDFYENFLRIRVYNMSLTTNSPKLVKRLDNYRSKTRHN